LKKLRPLASGNWRGNRRNSGDNTRRLLFVWGVDSRRTFFIIVLVYGVINVLYSWY